MEWLLLLIGLPYLIDIFHRTKSSVVISGNFQW